MEAINATRGQVWKEQPGGFLSQAFIDTDGTIAPTLGECKGGMALSYKGIWGYAPLIISLANTREVLYWLTGLGNVVSHEAVYPDRSGHRVSASACRSNGACDSRPRALFMCWILLETISSSLNEEFSEDRQNGLTKKSGAGGLIGFGYLEAALQEPVSRFLAQVRICSELWLVAEISTWRWRAGWSTSLRGAAQEHVPPSPDHAQYYCDHDNETRDAQPGKQISDACIDGAYMCKRNLRDHDPGPR